MNTIDAILNFAREHYLILKTLHIVSSVLLVGTGFGSAFYMFFVNRTNNLPAQVEVSRLVVRADWWFTTPAVLVQPTSGLAMVYAAGWTWQTPWVYWSLILYAFAGLCWLPVVWLQIQMKSMAENAYQKNEVLPALYWRYTRMWEYLGYPAFVAMVFVFYLMVNKPNW